MDNRRMNRISEEMKREVSEIIQNRIKDPRIQDLTSVSFVDVSRDLSFANIGISVFGSDKNKIDTIEGLNSAKGFVKKELGKRIKLRVMPEITFILDDSIEKGIAMQKLINEINTQD